MTNYSTSQLLIYQTEDKREVSREVDFRNLDMNISVGCGAKSHIAALFRQWVTTRLKGYLVKRFYQKVTDICVMSVDYDLTQPVNIDFFKTVQDKIHWAVIGNEAAEIIYQRSDSRKPNMGLTNWPGRSEISLRSLVNG